MSDLPMPPMIIATQSAPSAPLLWQLGAEVSNAADLDLGYEVAFPFLTAADDSSSATPAARS